MAVARERRREPVAPERRGAVASSLQGPLLLILAVWAVLISGRVVVERWGPGLGVLAAFAAATALVLVRCGRLPELGVRSLLASALGFAAGLFGYRGWVACIAWVGLAGGLESRNPEPGSRSEPAFALAVVVLAPIFEELLYRDRLIIALRDRAGPALAVLVSAALFALPHLEAWSVLGSWMVGLVLGALRLASRSLSLCVALHAGLNLAAVSRGLLPSEAGLSPLGDAAVGAFLLAFALLALRRSDSLAAAGWRPIA